MSCKEYPDGEMLAAAQLPTCSPLCGDEEGEKEEHWYSDAIESSPEPQARSALSWSLSSGHLQAGGGPRCCSLWLTPLLHCLGSRHWEDLTTEGDSLLSPRKILRWFFLWKSGLKQQQQQKSWEFGFLVPFLMKVKLKFWDAGWAASPERGPHVLSFPEAP